MSSQLQTSNANYPVSNNSVSGKRISFAPSVQADATTLRKAARAGYYYPMLALKQINTLSTGAAGKGNVYIPSINTAQANSFQMFDMYMPGIKATIERRPNDNYVVTSLALSEGYKSIDRGGDKPGIYAVSKGDGYIPSVTYKSNGRITPQDGRVVVVCDTDHTSPEDAALDAMSRLKKTAGRVIAENGNFDIMYSPVGRRLGGGFKRYNACNNTEANVFAGMLSHAMVDSTKRKNVNWIAEHGGSTVLTQAMVQLAQQNVSFKDQKHTVYMYHPATDPMQALELAHKLNLQIGDEFARVRGWRTPIHMLSANAKRAQNPSDEYDWKDYAKDLSNGGMNGVALAGVGLFAAGLASTTPAIALASGVVSGICGAQLLWTKGKNLLTNT